MDEAPRYLIRDRDGIYGAIVTRRLRAMGIRDKPIALGSPRQNGYAEQLIGSIRRECVDHVIVLGEAHLRRTLRAYADHYNGVRDAPLVQQRRANLTIDQRGGLGAARPILGGLHHHYARR